MLKKRLPSFHTPIFWEDASMMIFQMPGPLMQEEWRMLQCRPGIGRQILKRATGVFPPITSIVEAYHECWDGHGYPASIAALIDSVQFRSLD